MRVLVTTNMWPGEVTSYRGIFVQREVEALRCERPDWTFEVFPIAGIRGRSDYLAAIARLRRRLREGYDLVHAHYGLTGLTTRLAADGTPMVLTLHGDDVNRRWQRVLTRLAARRSRAVIAVSQHLSDLVGVPSTVIACGIPMDVFAPDRKEGARSRLGIDPNSRIVLFPADPRVPVKNHDLFAKALAQVRDRFSEPLVARSLADVAPDEVADHMAVADVVVLTSRSEGSPLVVREALASGVPVVSVPVGDVGRVLGGVPGCHVVDSDATSLAEAIMRVLSAPDDGFSEARRQRIRELGLDARTVARRVLEVYDRVLHEGRKEQN